jgi:predicted  nucleic acid-binding Zn-ribbon protein
LRDQLKRLEELQRYDAQIQELTNALSAIPAKLQATQADLARVETLLNAERAQLAESQRYYSEQKGLLEADESHINSAKHKLGQAKNSKEYVAAQREMDSSKESVQNREAEMSKLVDAVKAKEKMLADRDADVQSLRDSIAKDSEVARGKMTELEGKIAALKTERDKIAGNVRPEVLKRYGAIRMRRGLAIVSVRNGTCTGCNMNMPPQLYNTLQRGTSLETCPYCHRMIYWEEIMKDPAEAAAAPASPEKPQKPEKTARR